MSTTETRRKEIVEIVFDQMAEGQMLADTVRKLARAGERHLTPGMVRQWIVRDEETCKRYQRMKPMLGQALAEEAILVARESTSSTTATDRVLIETLKWAASKANPVEYGDKQTIEHQGMQTLQVKVVEDDIPVRSAKALESAVVASTLALSAGVAVGG
jgi:hypothetical protein